MCGLSKYFICYKVPFHFHSLTSWWICIRKDQHISFQFEILVMPVVAHL